jgi:glutathione-regulated potassium-efflux system ancillary protein KefC
LRVAFLLAQGGEFGFVLFGSAKALGVIDDLVFVMAVAIISVTMLLTPLLVKLGNWLALRAEDAPAGIHDRFRHAAQGKESGARVVIGGYGRVGHTVGTILASSGISCIAFDTDAVLVAKWRSEGHPVFYGDIGDPELLATSPMQGVDLVVLTIDDQHVAVRAAAMIRSHAPEVTIVARARDLAKLRGPAASRCQQGLSRTSGGQPASGSGGPGGPRHLHRRHRPAAARCAQHRLCAGT